MLQRTFRHAKGLASKKYHFFGHFWYRKKASFDGIYKQFMHLYRLQSVLLFVHNHKYSYILCKWTPCWGKRRVENVFLSKTIRTRGQCSQWAECRCRVWVVTLRHCRLHLLWQFLYCSFRTDLCDNNRGESQERVHSFKKFTPARLRLYECGICRPQFMGVGGC